MCLTKPHAAARTSDSGSHTPSKLIGVRCGVWLDGEMWMQERHHFSARSEQPPLHNSGLRPRAVGSARHYRVSNSKCHHCPHVVGRPQRSFLQPCNLRSHALPFIITAVAYPSFNFWVRYMSLFSAPHTCLLGRPHCAEHPFAAPHISLALVSQPSVLIVG